MIKKLGKLIAATAIIGTAVAGGIALFNKYKANQEDLDDDFMDFDDDFDDDLNDDIDTSFDDDEEDDKDEEKAVDAVEEAPSRSYVNVSYDRSASTFEEDDDEVKDITEDDL